jgi:hypothetical protein
VNGPQRILLPSVQSLFLDFRFDGQSLATATGFLVECARGPALITNRHNVTGRHPETDKVISDTGGIPNEVVIHHNATSGLGRWVERTEPLLIDGHSLWFEHPKYGPSADVVALPLTNLAEVKCYPYLLQVQSSEILVMPADSISMVAMTDGGSAAFNGPITRFLGVYSGRINNESDLGIVWKATMLRELVSAIPPAPPKSVLSTLGDSFIVSRNP